jgi:hypothetical protein
MDNNDSNIINLDFLILILTIIVVALFISKYIMPNFDNNNYELDEQIKEYNIENYGDLPDRAINEISNSKYQLISNNDATNIINKSDQDTLTELSKNYNNMNNLPYLVNPNNTGKGFLNNKVKLVENPNSPLLKLDTKYKKEINQKINKCLSPPKQFFDGYNKYNDLRKVNYANFTSIGKNLIVPYTSYPVAS